MKRRETAFRGLYILVISESRDHLLKDKTVEKDTECLGNEESERINLKQRNYGKKGREKSRAQRGQMADPASTKQGVLNVEIICLRVRTDKVTVTTQKGPVTRVKEEYPCRHRSRLLP